MLVAFDFEGTLSKADPFVELGEQHGKGQAVASVLDRMASGDLDYEEGLHAVADHLSGLPSEAVEDALGAVRIDPAAADLLESLHREDHEVVVVSDAPERAIESCLEPAEFDLDRIVANRLPTDQNDALTGEIEGPLVGRTKADVLDDLATEEDVPLREMAAVGTDRRDLPMLQAAGTGIAVDPVPVVEAEADHVVPTIGRVGEWFAQENVT